MKKALFILLLAVSLTGYSQSYKVVKGEIVKTEKDTTKKDKVWKVKDGVTFYQGAKGGIYYWKKSKKTGKDYKVYLKVD